jgi:replicative DNA helicase
MHIPEGSILNAPRPYPVAVRQVVGQLLPDLMMGCLAQAVPERVAAEGYGDVGDPQAFIDGAENDIYALAHTSEKQEMQKFGKALLTEWNAICERANRGETMVGFSTGYPKLDEAQNGGPRKGWFVVVGGRPGMGMAASPTAPPAGQKLTKKSGNFVGKLRCKDSRESEYGLYIASGEGAASASAGGSGAGAVPAAGGDHSHSSAWRAKKSFSSARLRTIAATTTAP